MSHKYTRFCSAQALIRHISAPIKDQQALHTVNSVFKKPMGWVEQKYDREMLLAAINKITISVQPKEELVWMYVIQGGFWYHEMPFGVAESARFAHYQPGHLRFQPKSVYAVLTETAMREIKQENEFREKEKILRFIKSHVFYPSYLEDQLVREFAMVLRIKSLPYGKQFTWKDEDGSCKFAVIYRGVVSIQYQWKRNIQIAEVTRGMFLTNHYIKDDIQELDDLSLDPVRDTVGKKEEFPKFRFISKAQDTVLLVFNARLVSESPYNVNPQLKANIKRQFQKYTANLQSIIGFEEFNRLHRNKRSIKQQLKKRKQKEVIKSTVSMGIQEHKKLSPILQTFSNTHFNSEQAYDTISAEKTDKTESKLYSHAVFSTISHTPSKLTRSKTSPISEGHSKSALIHNTWVQQMTKKRKNVKSFSTLKTLSTYHTERHKYHQTVQQELQQQKETPFFVPNQFVKRKLKLKYEDLISKIKNFDLTTTHARQESLIDKMKRLEDYIDSKRIVRLNSVKTKHKLMRDKVQY